MADGSVREEDRLETVSKPVSTILIGQDSVLDFVLPTDMWGPEDVGEVSVRLMRLANSSLRIAICRGEDETDPPGTLTEALEGASVLLQLAIGAADAAKAPKQEVRHG